MTGAVLHVTIEDKQIAGAMGGLKLLAADKAGIMRAIGVALVETTQSRFETATDPDGNAWRGLSPAYAATKQGLGILRESGMRGGLQASITFEVSGPSQVTIGTNKVYGAIHQFGGTVTPKNAKALVFRLGGRLVRAKRVTIPARPYLGFGRADEEAVQDVVTFLVGRALRRS